MEVIKCTTRDNIGDTIVVNNMELEIEKIKYLHANSGVNLNEVNQTYRTVRSKLIIDTLFISYLCDSLEVAGTVKAVGAGNSSHDLPFTSRKPFAYIPKHTDTEMVKGLKEEVSKNCPYNSETLGKYLLCDSPRVNPDSYVYELPIYYCKSEILPENSKTADDVYFVIPSFTINKEGKLVHKGYSLFDFKWYRQIRAISEDAIEVGKEIKRLRF